MAIWGHCGWKGNKVGRLLRKLWVFGGKGGFGNRGESERRGLHVLGERDVIDDGEGGERGGVCGRCSDGYGAI